MPFILITSYTVLNLFIGIVVDAMHRQHAEDDASVTHAIADESRSDRAEILSELQQLRKEIAALKKQLKT